MIIYKKPHRRKNILTGEWVLVSPQRTKRPWKGQVENVLEEKLPEYDPNCYLCPGNKRANGVINPDYKSTFVFQNDFPALLDNKIKNDFKSESLFRAQTVSGTCRVLCFSPKHNLTLAKMNIQDIRKVIDVWIQQVVELGSKYRWVQIFENRGSIMGSSNPHPHGQIWATSWLPNEIYKEDVNQREYYQTNAQPILLDYITREQEFKKRIVTENENWIFLVPFWAIWPFETLLIPKRHITRLPELKEQEKNSLARIIKRMLSAYDKLFNISFPYSMGWHAAPNVISYDESDNQKNNYLHWQLHAHFYPPLLRSASVKKFFVGFEMLAEAQRDITPESAAKRLYDLVES